MPKLIEHIEAHLGRIGAGWAADIHGNPTAFQVVTTVGPIDGTVAYATIGLSNHLLTSSRSGKQIRHELVMLARERDQGLGIPGLLQQVGGEAIARGHAYLRGEVIGPRGSLWEGTAMEALYVSAPAYFPDSFAACETDILGTVIFAWLVPITVPEARYVTKKGWSTFEDVLAERDPDLLDLERHSVVTDSEDD